MKKNIYTERLIKFAKHLEKLENYPNVGEYAYAVLYMIEHGKHVQRGTAYHAWIFDCLPLLFPEHWYYDDRERQPFLKGLPKEDGSIAGVFDFFDLSPHEFIHLFDQDGKQEPYYYGGTFFLNEEFDGKKMFKHIMEFLQHKAALVNFDTRQN